MRRGLSLAHQEGKVMNQYICDHAGKCDISSEHVWCNTPFDINRLPENNHFNQPCSHCGCGIVHAIPYKEDKVKEKQEYKAKVANISMRSMGQKINCVDFRRACIEWLEEGYGICNDIPFSTLIIVAKKYNGIQCLIDKGFIEKVEPEVFYERGDKFKNNGEEYILARVSSESSNILNLINLNDGNIWANENIHVQNYKHISKSEFDRLNYGGLFIKVSK